nr:CRISPR-associated endonuclease Cas3'' [Pyrobaculum sp.]
MICCAYWDKGGECQEPYDEHIERVMRKWEVMRSYYRWVIKQFGFDVVEIAIKFHDLGKLARAYVDKNQRRFYRHEILGAYFALKTLEGEARYYIAAAVALHHEPIIVGAYIGQLGETRLNISALWAMLREADLGLACDYSPKDAFVEKALELWKGGISASDVVDGFRELLAFISAGTSAERRRKRLLVAGILHPLVVADSTAAVEGRGGEGTRIARAALAGAEPGLINI